MKQYEQLVKCETCGLRQSVRVPKGKMFHAFEPVSSRQGEKRWVHSGHASVDPTGKNPVKNVVRVSCKNCGLTRLDFA